MNEKEKSVIETIAGGVWHDKGGTLDELFHITQCAFCYVSPESEHS